MFSATLSQQGLLNSDMTAIKIIYMLDCDTTVGISSLLILQTYWLQENLVTHIEVNGFEGSVKGDLRS